MINYGVFTKTIVSFVTVAFVMVLVIPNLNRLKGEEDAPPQESTARECPRCLLEIPIKASRCGHYTQS